MISQSSEYALRAVVCLARSHGTPLTTQQIAVAARVPAGYLSKVLQNLARAGIVISQRGPSGGFVLARPPDQLTPLEVVRVTDGTMRIETCPLGLPEHGTRLCPLHRRLDDAAAQAERALGGVTIADMLDESVADPESDCIGRRCDVAGFGASQRPGCAHHVEGAAAPRQSVRARRSIPLRTLPVESPRRRRKNVRGGRDAKN